MEIAYKNQEHWMTLPTLEPKWLRILRAKRALRWGLFCVFGLDLLFLRKPNLCALRSKRARYEDETPSETGSDEAAAPPVEKRPRAASEGLVIPQAKRPRANSDDRAPGLRRRVTCDDLRALEALELLREAAGGAF